MKKKNEKTEKKPVQRKLPHLHAPQAASVHAHVAAHAEPSGSSKFHMLAHAGLFLVLLPLALYEFMVLLRPPFELFQKLIPEPSNTIIGAACALLGIILYLWAARTQIRHGSPTPLSPLPFHRLVTAAPYDITRNPAFLGLMLLYFGISFLLNSLAYLLLALAFAIIAVLYLKFIEEPAIARAFGEEYGHYKRNTPFLLPGF